MIRVKDFAKVESSQLKDEPTKAQCSDSMLVPVDIEIVSLSSTEEIKTPVRKKTEKQTLNKKPIRNRTPKPPLKYKYHKISEYFHATKKECK